MPYSLKKHKGTLTWKFNQSDFSSVYKSCDKTKNGICQTLASKWLADFRNKTSLQASISNAKGKVDPAKIALLSQHFGTNLGTNGSEQQQNAKDWLGYSANLQQKGTGLAGGDYRKKGSFNVPHPDMNCIYSMLDGRLRYIKKGNAYVLMSIFGRGFFGKESGHALAMIIKEDRSVMFFDPNCGEMTFSTYKDFKGWFPTFMKSQYGGWMDQKLSLSIFV